MFVHSTALDRHQDRIADWREYGAELGVRGPLVRLACWWLLHNSVIHLLLGLAPVSWVFRLHDWSSDGLAGLRYEEQMQRRRQIEFEAKRARIKRAMDALVFPAWISEGEAAEYMGSRVTFTHVVPDFDRLRETAFGRVVVTNELEMSLSITLKLGEDGLVIPSELRPVSA